MTEPEEQLALFLRPPDAPAPRARTLRELDAANRPRWTKYSTVGSVHCDECVIYLHERDGVGPVPRQARWKLTVGKRSWLFCEDHSRAHGRTGT